MIPYKSKSTYYDFGGGPGGFSNQTFDNYTATLPITIAAGESAGLVTSADGTTYATSQNAIKVAIDFDANTCVTTKKVAGVETELDSSAITYSAGANLVTVKDGTSFNVFYNNTKITEETISDASIIYNKIHGKYGDSTADATIVRLALEAQVLANSEFTDTTLGAELVNGSNSNFDTSVGNTWNGSNLGTWDVDNTVSGKGYMVGDGGSDIIGLGPLVTAGRYYSASLKSELDPLDAGGMASTTIRFGSEIGSTDQYFELTPTGTEAEYSGGFVAGDTALRHGLITGFNGIAFSIDDVHVQERTLDDWSVSGTRDATAYLVMDPDNDTLRIVSDGDVIGVNQACGDATLYKYEVVIEAVVAGELKILSTGALVDNITSTQSGYIITDSELIQLYRSAGATDMTINSFKLWPVKTE